MRWEVFPTAHMMSTASTQRVKTFPAHEVYSKSAPFRRSTCVGQQAVLTYCQHVQDILHPTISFRLHHCCINLCAQKEIAGCTPKPSKPSIDCTGFETPYFVLIVLVRLAMSHPRGCPYLKCLNRKAGMSMDAPLEAERFVGSEVHG